MVLFHKITATCPGHDGTHSQDIVVSISINNDDDYPDEHENFYHLPIHGLEIKNMR